MSYRLATIFKRPFPIPLQLAGPQVLARPRLDYWPRRRAKSWAGTDLACQPSSVASS